jgi:hypothetical protein
MTQPNENVRERHSRRGFDVTIRDIRDGCRSLVRAPGFPAAVLLTLALTIGANATVFSVMHAVMWRPLPYPAADGRVKIWSSLTSPPARPDPPAD